MRLKNQAAPFMLLGLSSRPLASILVLVCILAVAPASAQTFAVIYNFTMEQGFFVNSRLAIDRGGNLYGTSTTGANGGSNCEPDGCGEVFKLSRRNSPVWVLTPLHVFTGGSGDGRGPTDGVIMGANGTLYGTTAQGGGLGLCNLLGQYGCGTVYKLAPPATVCKTALCPWMITLLYRFSGEADGGLPYGGVIFDAAGDMFGTTLTGGNTGVNCVYEGNGCGVVFELSPSSGGWTENALYNFAGSPSDAGAPEAGVTFDSNGDLFGAATLGGNNNKGAVYELTPSGSGWSENVIYNFQGENDGLSPVGGLIMDQAGNLYGTTPQGGSGQGGTVFELTPSGESWTFTTLYSFYNADGQNGAFGPYDRLTMDAGGNLYGTTNQDGAYGCGNVFKLTPSGNGWTYASLYDFTCGADGGYAGWGVTFDNDGNLYGVAGVGGKYGWGVAWEITP
jgi:uncharacterized repeat protein (TIGR03803 family)